MAQKASKKWTSSQAQSLENSRFFTLPDVQILFPRKVKNWSFEQSSKDNLLSLPNKELENKRENESWRVVFSSES